MGELYLHAMVVDELGVSTFVYVIIDAFLFFLDDFVNCSFVAG